MARPGRYSVSGKSTAADFRTFDISGVITLHHDASVSGMLTDGPLAGGSWNSKQLSFLLIYNAELPFLYSLRIRSPKSNAQCRQAVRCKGSWQLDGARGLEDSNHGTLKLQLHWQADIPAPVPSHDTNATTTTGGVVAPQLSLPLPGDDGNRACEVRPVTTLSVPCSMCSEDQANLSFFDMKVPHFGTAELVSFSCDVCGYKYNKVGTAVGQRPGAMGKTIRLQVACDADLKREVVVSDVATVRLAAVELEVPAIGRYTTVEGLISGLASGLSRAALVDGSNASTPVSAQGQSEADSGLRGVVDSIETRIKDMMNSCVASPFTVEISDPLALSFIAELPLHDADPGQDVATHSTPIRDTDDRLEVQTWSRSEEDDLELGLVDATRAGELWAAATTECDTSNPSAGAGQADIKIGSTGLAGDLDTYEMPLPRVLARLHTVLLYRYRSH